MGTPILLTIRNTYTYNVRNSSTYFSQYNETGENYKLSITMTEIVANKWQNGEFGCCADPGNCCFGCCCLECMICSNAKGLGKLGGEQPPWYCLLATFFPIVGIFLLRQHARETYGIEGD